MSVASPHPPEVDEHLLAAVADLTDPTFDALIVPCIDTLVSCLLGGAPPIEIERAREALGGAICRFRNDGARLALRLGLAVSDAERDNAS